MPIVEGAEQMIRRDLPFHSVEESDDGRWYIIDGQRLMSVTTAFNAIAKRGLVPWAGKLAAEQAFADLPTLVAASRRKPCERTRNRCQHDPDATCELCPCRVCRSACTKWIADRHLRETARRADEGTRVHDVAEWWSFHGEIKDHDEPDIAPYVKSFQGVRRGVRHRPRRCPAGRGAAGAPRYRRGRHDRRDHPFPRRPVRCRPRS
jgi:hypothetical protein